jgi:hypothetical protein
VSRDPKASQSFGRSLKYLLIMVPLGVWTLGGKTMQQRIWRTAAVTVCLGALNWGLQQVGLQMFRPPWNWVLDALSQGLIIALANLLDYWISPRAFKPESHAAE